MNGNARVNSNVLHISQIARARTFAHVCIARECGQKGEKPPAVCCNTCNSQFKREKQKERNKEGGGAEAGGRQGGGGENRKKRKGICGVHLKHLPEYFRRPVSGPEISPDTRRHRRQNQMERQCNARRNVTRHVTRRGTMAGSTACVLNDTACLNDLLEFRWVFKVSSRPSPGMKMRGGGCSGFKEITASTKFLLERSSKRMDRYR